MSGQAACTCCGKIHRLDELELCYRRPDPVVALGREERDATARETDDLCSIGEDHYFIRAVLPLPVWERERSYNLGVWAQVSQDAFFRVIDLWDDPDQANEPPFEAMLANRLPDLPDTSGMPVQLELTGPKTRPRIVVPASSQHPLHEEQRRGITAHRASEYTHSLDRSKP